MILNWTKDKPEKAGFYWFKGRSCSDTDFPYVTHVFLDDQFGSGVLYAIPYMMDFQDKLDNFDGEWAGPIDQPKD